MTKALKKAAKRRVKEKVESKIGVIHWRAVILNPVSKKFDLDHDQRHKRLRKKAMDEIQAMHDYVAELMEIEAQSENESANGNEIENNNDDDVAVEVNENRAPSKPYSSSLIQGAYGLLSESNKKQRNENENANANAERKEKDKNEFDEYYKAIIPESYCNQNSDEFKRINEDPMRYWIEIYQKWPIMFEIAEYTYSSDVTEVESERVFKAAKRVFRSDRGQLAPKTGSYQVFLHDYFSKGDPKQSKIVKTDT